MSIINVLYIHHTGDMDGSSISLFNLITCFDREQIIPSVLLAKDGPFRRVLEASNIQVDILPINCFWTSPGPSWYEWGFITNFRAFLPNKKLRNYLYAKKPDIVHINDKVLLAAGIVAHQLHYPIVWHSRTTYHITKVKVNVLISSFIIKHISDCIISISEDEMDRFEDFEKLFTIYNSVNSDGIQKAIMSRNNTREALGLKQEELGVGYFGPLTEIRGAWDFIKAAGINKAIFHNDKTKYFMVGKIPKYGINGLRAKLGFVPSENPKDIIQRLVEEANINDQLTILGFRADALNVMAALDIVIVYSRRGVLGRPPFEAMAMGIPVIVAAGHSGKSTIVLDGLTGLVIPQAKPYELAKAMHSLETNPQLRNQMSEYGSKYASINFCPKKNAEKIIEIYKNLLLKSNQ